MCSLHMYAKATPNVVLGEKYPIEYLVTDAQGRTMQYEHMYYIYANEKLSFCIEPGILLNQGSSYSSTEFTGEQQRYMSLLAYYGWEKTSKTVFDYTATQFMIWEYLGATLHSTSFTQYHEYKERIQKAVELHSMLPSFHDATYEVSLGETIQLEDQNKVLEDFIVSFSKGFSLQREQNKLFITPTQEATAFSTIKFQKIPEEFIGVSIVYQSDTSQDVVTLYAQDRLEAKLHMKVNASGRITIEKEDDETGKDSQTAFTFEGAEFHILNEQDEVVDELIIGSNGKAISKDLPFGVYKIKEIKAPQGYLINPEIQIVTLNAQQVEATIIVKDPVIKGQIALHKFIDEARSKDPKSSLKKPLSNVSFKIISDESNEVVDVLITNEEGYAISKQLPYGWYSVQEEEVEGFDKLEAFKVFINEDQKVFHYLVENTMTIRKNNLEVIKRDNVTKEVLSNAEITLYDEHMQVIETKLSDEKGSVLFSNLLSGIYYVKETKAPDGYHLSEDIIQVVISDDDVSNEYKIEILNVKIEEAVATGDIHQKNLYIVGLFVSCAYMCKRGKQSIR
ncbi:MAG: Cys-Gln thioester bond-forming surface protein [Erysipelotrichaceae bacterium]|nr:Cys-Gln thioester bond-forming surface protein [Erysipelotrichaceae bacterium]